MADLTGLTILVTRPEPRGHLLCELIEQNNGNVIYFPTISFKPAPNPSLFQENISNLDTQDWVIFISPQAVLASVSAIHQAYVNWPAHVKIAAIGSGTAQLLEESGLSVALQPESEWYSERFLELPAMQAISGLHIAVIRGVGGRELLDRVLAERGALVTPILAYERTIPTEPPADLVCQALIKNRIDAIVGTSFESVLNLKTRIGEAYWPYLQKTPLTVMGERVKLLAEDLGFRTIWVTPQASNNAILALLIRHLAEQ